MRVVNLNNLPQFTAVQLLLDPGHIAGPVQVPQAAQIVLGWTLEDAKIAHCVLYGRYVGTFAGNNAQAAALTNAFFTGSTWTALAGFLAASTTAPFVTIRDVNTPNNVILFPGTNGSPGTSASPSMPNEVAAVVTLSTAKAGRAFRGRAYIPGWATNALGAGNIIAAGAVTALNNWAATWKANLTAQGYTLVLGHVHRQAYTSPITGRVFPDRPADTVDVTTAICKDNHWDSQRRRGLK